MGSFNSTGFVSGLRIRCNDPIVAIPCVITSRSDKFNATCCYTTSQLTPVSLPFFGKYNDYGSIKDIEDTPSARAWKLFVCDNIEGCMTFFERANRYETTLDEIIGHNKEYYDKTGEIEKGLRKILRGTDGICLVLEHRKVYEELISNKDNKTKSFFEDVMSYQKSLDDKGIVPLISFYRNPFSSPLENIIFALSDNKLSKIYDDVYKNNVRELEKIADKFSEKHGQYTTIKNFFCGWEIDFVAYRLFLTEREKRLYMVDGIADALSDFSTFDNSISHLNIGYRVPSCGCGGQDDNNADVIKFHSFLADFYENNLKNEYEEDDWEDEEE